MADGMLPQVRRQIANAEWSGLSLAACPMGCDDSGLGSPHVASVVVPGSCQLQHGVVGMGGNGERRNPRHQDFAAHPLPWRHDRPFALPLPERKEMLYRLSLIAVEIQALPQHRLGGSVLVPC